MSIFSNEEYWKSIILYGLNASTYKIALGKTLLTLAQQGQSRVSWENLSLEFLSQYKQRLNVDDPMPQLDNPARKTVMERIVHAHNLNLSLDEAVSEVGKMHLEMLFIDFITSEIVKNLQVNSTNFKRVNSLN